MESERDIIITGGGLAGSALALALATGGLRTTLIDALPAQTRKLSNFDGRSYALALASVRLLTAVGLWDALEQNAEPMRDIKVTDGRPGEGPGPFRMHFDHHEIEEGPMGHMVEDRHLRQAFLTRVEEIELIEHLSPETVVAQEIGAGHARVTLESGQTLSAQLLVGADGRGSGTAERAGIARKVTDYGQTALVAAIGHEKPHNGVAHQFFLPHGPLAILPLTGNRSSIVWAETHERAAEIEALSDEKFLEALHPVFGDFLGGLHLAGPRFSYPLNNSIAAEMAEARLALIGDAAHGVHPIAGQGLNQGLRDVGALAEVLVDARRRGEDIGAPDVLERYSQWRRFDAATLAAATDGFNRLFSNDNPLLRLGRGLGMGVVNAIPPLRRGFIREAAGLTGDLPRLMRGQPL